jgi:hypothetical protein
MGIASLVVLMLYLVGIAGVIAVANGGRVANGRLARRSMADLSRDACFQAKAEAPTCARRSKAEGTSKRVAGRRSRVTTASQRCGKLLQVCLEVQMRGRPDHRMLALQYDIAAA